ncbi:MAG: hypothetical protein U9N44_06895 [Chloroflexota bacterium]|nr:hypothetical protein [Chloroflexota bacterium]
MNRLSSLVYKEDSTCITVHDLKYSIQSDIHNGREVFRPADSR